MLIFFFLNHSLSYYYFFKKQSSYYPKYSIAVNRALMGHMTLCNGNSSFYKEVGLGRWFVYHLGVLKFCSLIDVDVDSKSELFGILKFKEDELPIRYLDLHTPSIAVKSAPCRHGTTPAKPTKSDHLSNDTSWSNSSIQWVVKKPIRTTLKPQYICAFICEFVCGSASNTEIDTRI